MEVLNAVGRTPLAVPFRPSKQPRSRTGRIRAASESDAPKSPSSSGKDKVPLPEIGFFKLADPNAEVYSKAGDKFDPQKKGGRWKPEFIWNTNWQEQLKIQEDLERQMKEYKEQQQKGGNGATGPGVVSLSRLSALDDLNVDLTEQLIRKKKAEDKAKRAASTSSSSSSNDRQAAGPASSSSSQGGVGSGQQRLRPGKKAAVSPSYQFRDKPARTDARRFQRSTRVATKGASLASVGQPTPEEAARLAQAQAEERVRYEALKREFQIWTLASAALGTGIAYFVYSKDTAFSYTVGALGGLLYLRLLGKSVDSLGGGGGGGGLGQPRLLIPVILALTYNRWNQLYAGEYGVTLQLIPELLGFFTYKLAVVTRQGMQVMAEFSEDVSYTGNSGGAEGSEEGDDGGAMTLDRIFVKKATSGW